MWIASLLATAAPLVQTERWQQLSINRASRFLDRQRILMADLHVAENAFEDALHKRKLSLARELHLTEMAHDLGIAHREAVRDDWQQHSMYLQSLMMMASLMFSCVCAIFCEAGISLGSTVVVAAGAASNNNATAVATNNSSWDAAASPILFSVLCALGISSSLLSLWLGMKIQARMAEFDFHSPNAVYLPCNTSHFEFSEYHACHLQKIERASFVLFLVSVVCTLLVGALTYCASIGAPNGNGAYDGDYDDGESNTIIKDWKIPFWVPILIAGLAVSVIVCGSFFGFSKMKSV